MASVVAASAGNLWKTENRGNTWTPIFETYGSYSLAEKRDALATLAARSSVPVELSVDLPQDQSQRPTPAIETIAYYWNLSVPRLSKWPGFSEQFTVDGKPVAWKRDPLDVFAFKVAVPKGAKEVIARFVHTSPLQSSEGRISMTQEMLNLQWEKMSLYPAGHYVRRIAVRPKVTFPKDWKVYTALDGLKRARLLVFRLVGWKLPHLLARQAGPLVLPAYEFCMKSSHQFNSLDAQRVHASSAALDAT